MVMAQPYATKPSVQAGTYYSWNLISNPGFEMATENWNATGTAVLNTLSNNSYSSIYSVKISGRSNASAGIQQDISSIITKKGPGKYWIGAAIKISTGVDSVIITLKSGANDLSFTAKIDTGWNYVKKVLNISTISNTSSLSISTKNTNNDIVIDEVWLRKAEDLSQYNFTYPSTYPVVQTFRQSNDNENAYFPIMYDMFNSSMLSNNKNIPGKMLIGQSSWGAVLNWGRLQYASYPYDNRGSFFPGWYTYYAGTRLVGSLTNVATTVSVKLGSTLIKAGDGKYYSAAIIARNVDGTPNWNKVEHVEIDTVIGNVVTINRGSYKSPVFSYTVSDSAYIAQKPGWISGHDQWMLNLSLVGPRDPATGMNGADFWAYYYKDFFNDRPYLHGLQFDVSSFVPGSSNSITKIDINNDGIADYGTIDGVNVAGLGNQVALKKMREYIGENKILVYDYEHPSQARSTKYIDGASFEAALIENHVVGREFAYLEGINQIVNERPLRYSYVQQVPNGDVPISDQIGRMGIAAASMLEVPYVNQYTRTLGVVYWRDEYFGGEDINKQGWLGEPNGPIVKLTHFNPTANLLSTATWTLQKDVGSNATFSNSSGTITSDVTLTAGNVSGVRLASDFSVSQLDDAATYTLIFDARGDDDFTYGGQTFENVPRYLQLINSGARGNNVNALSSIGENVTNEWRHYEISFTASTATDVTKKLSFGIGEMKGITQIRNIQLYKGSGHILSRQFEYGTVLLNASETPYTFNIPGNFRRIKGK